MVQIFGVYLIYDSLELGFKTAQDERVTVPGNPNHAGVPGGVCAWCPG